MDIAIVGRGNFCILDHDNVECRYTRSGKLVLDANGQLAIKADGAEWLIDPPITIPNDWERLAILNDGRVQTLQADTWMDVGQLQLAVFTRTPTFNDPLSANSQSDAVGPPTLYMPGNVAGLLQQGWAEQRAPVLNALAIRLLLAILAAGVLLRCTRAVVGIDPRTVPDGG